MEKQVIEEMQYSEQIENLKRTLAHLAANSPFYQRHFQKHGIDIDSIDSISALTQIPTVSKDDIQESPLDFWAIPRNKVIDFSNTSGTQGQPITIPLSEMDLQRLGEVEKQSFQRVGITADDVILLTTTANRRFMAGLAYVLGARAIGAGLIRMGPGLIENQWTAIQELQPTVIIAVPSFVVKMIAFAEEHGINFKSTSVKKIICIGESIRNSDFSLNALGTHLTDRWNVELFSTYASSEMQTAFTECTMHNGAHASGNLIIPQIEGADGNPVADGLPGELVISSLGVEGFPLLRFRTGDVCSLYTEPCACGDPSPRVGPVLGRLKQMIKYKGTTCYPLAISSVLDGFPEILEYQIQISKDDFGNDKVVVYYHERPDFVLYILTDTFRSNVRFIPELISVSAAEIDRMVHPENMRKAQRLVDLR